MVDQNTPASTKVRAADCVLDRAGKASVITSKPAIYDHFKTGQRGRAQNMNLFYRAGASSGKFGSVSP